MIILSSATTAKPKETIPYQFAKVLVATIPSWSTNNGRRLIWLRKTLRLQTNLPLRVFLAQLSLAAKKDPRSIRVATIALWLRRPKVYWILKKMPLLPKPWQHLLRQPLRHKRQPRNKENFQLSSKEQLLRPLRNRGRIQPSIKKQHLRQPKNRGGIQLSIRKRLLQQLRNRDKFWLSSKKQLLRWLISKELLQKSSIRQPLLSR